MSALMEELELRLWKTNNLITNRLEQDQPDYDVIILLRAEVAGLRICLAALYTHKGD